jgi:hypothetical protein
VFDRSPFANDGGFGPDMKTRDLVDGPPAVSAFLVRALLSRWMLRVASSFARVLLSLLVVTCCSC